MVRDVPSCASTAAPPGYDGAALAGPGGGPPGGYWRQAVQQLPALDLGPTCCSRALLLGQPCQGVVNNAPGKHRPTACSARAGGGVWEWTCMHPTQAAAGASWGLQMGCMPATSAAPAAQGLICMSWTSCAAQGRAQGLGVHAPHPGGSWRWLGPPDGVHAAIRHCCSRHLPAHPHIPRMSQQPPIGNIVCLLLVRLGAVCIVLYTREPILILRTPYSATPLFYIPHSPGLLRSGPPV